MKHCLYFFTLSHIILFFIFCGSSLLAQPIISSFTPTSGNFGSTITITGSGFAVPHTNNAVYFGGARAISSAGTATSLTVTVPAGAASVAPITVVNLLTNLQASSLRVTGTNTAYFTVTYSTPIAITATSFVQQNIAVAGTGEAVAIGDFNGDGRPDIAVGINDTSPADNIGILINNGSGFDAPVYYGNASSRSIYSIRAGDIDNDGDLDLVANTYNVGSNQVHVLQNDGTGVFVVLTSFSNTDTAREIYLADFNNDGRLDIITNGRGRAHLTLNTGGMSFGTPTQIGGSNASESIAIGDFNKDGNLDFLSCAYGSNQVFRFLGDGAGGFDAGTAYAAGTSPANATVGFFLGGDTYPDAVVSPYFGSALTLMQNNTGSLGTPSTITATDPRGSITVDLNGDGLHDVLSVRYNASRNPLIFLNNGSGLNTPIVMTTASASGTGHARFDAADLDGDGFIDFVASTDGSAIRVNRYTPPPSFYSLGNASWNANGNWSSTDGGADCACNPAGVANASVYIKSGHTVSVATAANIGVNNNIDVEGTLTLSNGNTNNIQALTTSAGSIINLVAGNFNLANPATTTINGTINRQTTGAFPNGLTFANGSTYIHAVNGGTIPTATWGASSECRITGTVSTSPTGFAGQTFGNLTWNTSAQTVSVALIPTGTQTITVQGNFTLNSTGSGALNLVNGGGAVGTMNVGGDFISTNPAFSIASNNATGIMNVTGNVDFVGTAANHLRVMSGAGSAGTLTVNGNFSTTFSSVIMWHGIGNLTVNGNLSLGASGAAISASNSSTSMLTFVGTNAQTFSATTGIFVEAGTTFEIRVSKPSNTVSLTSDISFTNTGSRFLNITSGTFDINTHTMDIGYVQGTGTLALSNTLNITDTNASLFIGTLNATTGSLINYNGTVPQNIFAPSSGSYGRLTLTNANMKTLLGNIGISGNFTNNAGVANFDATTNSTTVSFNGAAAQTLTGASTFYNLTINQSVLSSVTLNNPVTVANTLTLNNGIILLTNGNDLTVQGTGTGAITGYSSVSYVRTKTGANSANLVRSNLGGIPGTYYFPVGTDTEGYNLFAFSYGATPPAGNHSVKAITASTFSPLTTTANTKVVWEVLKPIGTNTNIYMDWQVPANLDGILTDGDALVRSDDNGATWITTGQTYNIPPSSATTFTTPAPFFVGSASPVRFAVVRTAAPLPTQPLGNRGLYFDGVDDVVNVPTHPISNDFTIEFWIKTTQTGTPLGTTYWQDGYGLIDNECVCADGDFGLSLANGKILFGAADQFVDYTDASNLTINDNRWHHIAMVRTQATGLVQLYIDGVLDKSVTHSTWTYGANQGLQFGKIRSSTNYFNGQLDEIRIFNTVRTPAQIQTDMATQTPNGALAYWNLDQGTGTIVNDISGNGYNGTLTASPQTPLWAYQVSNTLDDGSPGSLRWAINQANTDTDTDYIDFSIQQSNAAAVSTIALTSELPYITQPIIIDGYSAFGSVPNTNAFSAGNNAKLRIEINAMGIGVGGNPPNFNAMTIDNANNSIIKGLSIFGVPSNSGNQNAIFIRGTSTLNRIEGCYIGLRADGSVGATNMNGVNISGTVGGNILGWSGTLNPAAFNIIANSAFIGITTGSSNNIIQGNYIGTDKTGTIAKGNAQRGLAIGAAGTGNQILNNLISGNGASGNLGGLYIQWGANGTIVKGNKIGTRADGTGSIPNNGAGITITGNVVSATNNCIVGGTGTGEANIIANNSDFGVLIENGSFGASGNQISGNNIFGNISGGIALIGGSNASKVSPSVTAVTPTLASGTCEAGDIVEVFTDNPQTGTTNQGRVFLGTAATVGTTWTFAGTFAVGDRITATATSSTNNTSAFSNAFLAPFPAPAITSISPTEGEVGTPITINGSGFNPNLPNDIYFGAVKLTANANASGTSITVNVPAGAGTIFPITVRNNANNLQASSLNSNTPLFNIIHTPSLNVAPNTFAHQSLIPTGFGAEDISIGDLNNDGNPDIVVSNKNAYTISVLLGDGNGNFPTQNSFPAGSGATPFAGKNILADLDNDGDLDIAVLNDDDELAILINNGTGIFFTPAYLPTGGSIASGLASGDFNKDGYIDLIVTNFGFAPMTNNINVLRNNGSGISFTPNIISLGAGNAPAEVLTGDFDKNGNLDALLMINNDVVLLANDGVGNLLLAGTVYSGASNVRDLVLGDFNGDSHLDFALVQYSMGVVVLLGDGSFGFTAQNIPTGVFTNTGMASADFDGDGIDDLIVSNAFTEQVTLLLGDNSGSSFNTFAIDLAPFGSDNVSKVAVGDFNKDGKADFVTSQYGADGIIVSLYAVPPPIALAATNVTTAGFTASWTSTSSLFYDVEFADNVAFTGSTMLNNLSGTSATINVPIQGTTYYYRVRNGGATNFSNTRTVVIPPVPGAYRALQFDGTASYAQSNRTFNTTFGIGEFTIEAWIKDDGGIDRTIAHSSELTSNPMDEKFWRFYISSGDLHLDLSDGMYPITLATGGSPVLPNRWTHVAVSRNASGDITFYINGIAYLAGSDLMNFSNNGFLRIGATRGTVGSPTDDPNEVPTDVFSGEIDELRIWKSVRSLMQIRSTMCQKLIGNEVNLLAYYRFDELAGVRTENKAIGSETESILFGASRVVSGAALGDVSAFEYSVGTGFSLIDGETITASYAGLTLTQGVQLYKVQETPNSIGSLGFATLETSRYYGVFKIGNPSISFTLDYTNNPLLNTGTPIESRIRLGKRQNGADPSWRRRSLPANTNPATNTVVINNLLESGELIAGIANPLPLKPGAGTALSFNGTNQYVDLGDNDALDLAGTPFTLEAWVKMPATIAAQQHTILGKGIDNTNIAYRFDVSGTTRRAGILVGNGSMTGGITTLIPIPADEWTHIAVTYNGINTLNIYQNGILQNTGGAPLIVIPNGTDNARIGSLQISPTNFFQGQIDEVRIWNVERNIVDIRNTMCQKLTGSETNLVSYYRFDEGVGATVTNDWAGSSDGQFFNAPAIVFSGAALGDVSANQYDVGTSVGVSDTDLFSASFIATPLTTGQGVHVYKVREAPNVVTLPAGTTLMETSRYFGVFKVNAPNADITYKYDANPNINGTPQEFNAVFLERDNNADLTWSLPLVPTNFAMTLPANKFMSPPTPAVITTHREFVVAFSSSVPNIQSSNIQFTSVTSNSIGLRWTNGNGQNRLVLMSTSPFFTPPTNGSDYPVGQNIGTGTVIYNGSGNIATANSLVPETQYYFHIFEYNGTGASIIYNIAPATGNPNSISTLSIAPQSQPTGLTFTNVTTTTATVSFTPTNPLAEGYLAVIRRPTDMPTSPADGAEYTVGTQFFNGQVVVFSGASTAFNLTGLIPATVYIIDIYAFNGGGNNTAYNKIHPLSGEFRTLSPLPQLISISPNLKTVGDRGFIMQLNGNGFIRETQALWFGQALSTTFVNTTTLTAEIPDNRLFEAGVFPISVTSPSPGGGTSNALPFTVIPLVNIQSVPLVSRIVPPDRNNHLLYRLEFFSAGGETALRAIKFTTAGSYQSSDLKDIAFTLWASSDEELNENDKLLLTAPRVPSGSALSFDLSNMAEQIKFPRNGRGYILLSVNISAEAKQGNEIKINSVKFEDIEFANAVTKQGKDPAEEGIAQKIAATTPTPQDYSALVRFFNDMGGKDWLTPWNLDNPVTSWKGVELDEDGNVIALSLPNNNLVGKLSDAVMTDGILISQSLRYINLSGNKIEGQIPINLKNLGNLEYLDLSNNQLSGKIGSEINSLTHLVTLWLAYNQFTEIDIDFAKLPNLKNLFLQHNNLQKLNDNIGDASNLEVLNLQGNQLKNLPETIGKLSKLKYLDISNNNLIAVPQSIVNLLSLETLLMHDNFIKILPNNMTNLQNLVLFTAYNNFLEFGSLEPLRNWWAIGQRNVNITYTPQGKIGQPQELIVQVGSPLTLKIETTGTANQYQWFKNNVPITEANDATFTISNLTVQEVGTYTLQVNNSLVPALTLQSHNIVVIADCGQVQSGNKPAINVEGASVFCGLEPVNTRLTTLENANISAYQWFFNGIQINNSNRNNILAQDAGRYRVQIFTRDGCSLLSDEMTITVLPEYSVNLVQNQLTLQAIVTAGRQISNYEWFLNDRIIPEATQGTYSPVEVGTYKVRVTDTNGCRSISNILTVNVVSIEENIYEGGVSVYPNPSTAIFYLELGEEKANKIQLFNALGKYYNEKVTPINAKKYQIDLDNQARGLYFIEIVTSKGKIIRKLVKE